MFCSGMPLIRNYYGAPYDDIQNHHYWPFSYFFSLSLHDTKPFSRVFTSIILLLFLPPFFLPFLHKDFKIWNLYHKISVECSFMRNGPMGWSYLEPYLSNKLIRLYFEWLHTQSTLNFNQIVTKLMKSTKFHRSAGSFAKGRKFCKFQMQSSKIQIHSQTTIVLWREYNERALKFVDTQAKRND